MRHSRKVSLPKRISDTVTNYTWATDGSIFTQIYKTIQRQSKLKNEERENYER